MEDAMMVCDLWRCPPAGGQLLHRHHPGARQDAPHPVPQLLGGDPLQLHLPQEARTDPCKLLDLWAELSPAAQDLFPFINVVYTALTWKADLMRILCAPAASLR